MLLAKKIFITSSIILVLLLLIWGAFKLSFNRDIPQATVVPPISKITSSINLISDEQVLSPVIDPKTNQIKYYSKENGKAYSIDFNGQNKQVLSTKVLIGLKRAIWSPDTTKVITEFLNGTVSKFFYYTYDTGVGAPLKDGLDDVAWKDNGKIIYKYYNPATQERTLDIANPDGTGWSQITSLNYKKTSLSSVPNSSLISFWNYPDSFTETILQTSPVLSGSQKTILSGKFGADYLWDTTGNNILVSSVDQKDGSKLQLAIMNSNGGEYKNLEIPTLVSKCVWSKDKKTVYYALPGSIPSNVVMPNDYLANKFTTLDTFWKINITTGEKSRIVELDKMISKYDAEKLFLNKDESSLFFVNKIDGKLYRIDL